MTVTVIVPETQQAEDTLAGNAAYFLAGRGNQTLTGNDGGDTYVFDWARMSNEVGVTRAVLDNGTDAGVDTILINGRPSSTARIVFDGTKYFLLLLQNPNVLSTSATAPDQRIELVGFNPSATGSVGIERIQFLHSGNLETWDRAAMLASLGNGTDSNDSLVGTAAADLLNGGKGNDTLVGGDGSDSLSGGAGNDSITGGGGDDILSGGAHADSLDGGEGGDLYRYASGDGVDLIADTGVTGTDVLELSNIDASNARLSFNTAGQLVLQVRSSETSTAWVDAVVLANTVLGSGSAGIEEIRFGSTVWDRARMQEIAFDRTGDGGATRVFGTTGGDVIVGGTGRDTLSGGDGGDRLVGGGGNDSLFGGEGADTYVYAFGDGVDGLSDSGTSGIDVLEISGVAAGNVRLVLNSSNQLVVQTRASATAAWAEAVILVDTALSGDAAAGIEAIRIVDAGVVWTRDDMRTSLFDRSAAATAQVVTATRFADVLRGGTRNDTLIAGAGDDLLFGNEGRDSLDGGEGSDRFVWSFRSTSVNDGEDTIRDSGTTGTDVLELRGVDPARVRFATATDGATTYYVLEILNSFAGIDAPAPVVVQRIHLRDNLVNVHNDGIGIEWIEFRSLDGTETLHSMTRADIVALQATRLVNGTTAANTTVLGAGADFYDGGAGDDFVSGGAGRDTLRGGADRDTLFGGADGDNLFGGAGNDSLDGGDGDDVLAGGAGNDTLDGGEGSDAFFYNSNVATDGTDRVSDRGTTGSDVLHLFGVDAANARIVRSGSEYVLQLLSNSVWSNAVVLADTDVMTSNAAGIEQILFRDASGNVTATWTRAEMRSSFLNWQFTQFGGRLVGTEASESLVGGSGNDTLDGGAGDDSLIGGTGNDSLDGGAGSDRFIYDYTSATANDGLDIVTDASVVTGEVDTLVINGVEAARVRIGISNGSPTVEISDGVSWRTAVVLADTDLSVDAGRGIETIRIINGGVTTDWTRAQMRAQFLDRANETGSVSLTGSAGDDSIRGGSGDDGLLGGSGNDTLSGGAGNDLLSGGGGSDRFIYNYTSATANDGRDTVTDASTVAGEIDTLVINGVSAADVRMVVSAGGPVVQIFNGTSWFDAIVLPDTDLSLDAGTGIERIEIGTTIWTRAEMRASILNRAGEQAVGLTLRGYATDDLIRGGTRSDSLFGGAGNDTIEGGAGNDSLDGGAGSDVFVHGTASGVDTVADTGTDGGFDVLRLTGIARSDVTFALSGTDINVLRSGTLIAVLTGIDTAVDQGTGIEAVRFDDGTTVTRADLHRMLRLTGGIGNDSLTGTARDETISGGAGNDSLSGVLGNDLLLGEADNDTLDGGAGNDTLDGGAGNDRLSGGTGDDVYVYRYAGPSSHDGNDTVNDTSTVAGETDVLRLEGVVPGQIALRRSGVDVILDIWSGAPNAPGSSVAASIGILGMNPDAAFGAGIERIDFVSPGGEVTSWTRIDMVRALLNGSRSGTITGTSRGDVIVGSAVADVISGNGGDDRLEGGAGDDRFVVSARNSRAGDTITVTDRGNDTGDVLDLSSFRSTDAVFTVDHRGLVIAVAGRTIIVSTDFVRTGGFGIDRITFSDVTYSREPTTGQRALFSLFPDGRPLVAGTWTGGAGSDTVWGLSGNDVLDGGEGLDEAFGGAGNDTITAEIAWGGVGNDSIVAQLFASGDEGDDTLVGGPGSTYYFYDFASGHDVVIDGPSAEADTIFFRRGTAGLPSIRPEDVRGRVNGIDLILEIMRDGVVVSSITIDGQFKTDGSGIENVFFEGSGVTWTRTVLESFSRHGAVGTNDSIVGGNGDDKLFGLGGNDTLVGGGGLDILYGGGGNDDLTGEIVFGGDGNDTIRMSVEPHLGTYLVAGDAGDDNLVGGTGQTFYYYNLGDGHDVIVEPADGANDILYLLSDKGPIRPEDVRGRAVGRDLVLEIVRNGTVVGSITLKEQFASVGSGIDQVVFTGTNVVWDRSRFDEFADAETSDTRADSIVGGPGDDRLYGLAGNDTITGGAGDDILFGGMGNDSLTGEIVFGGAGNDTISSQSGPHTRPYYVSGGAGNDLFNGGGGQTTYFYSLGDGHDRIIEPADAQSDEIVFRRDKGGIRPEDIRGRAVGTDLVLEIVKDGVVVGSITIVGQFTRNGAGIDRILFEDLPTVWDRSFLAAFSDAPGSSDTAASLTRDTIIGTAGDDALVGLGGDDSLVGGAGWDVLFGGAGNDTLVGEVVFGGNGNDSIAGEGTNVPNFLRGGTGRDTLSDNEGSTFYFYSRGDGDDVIFDESSNASDIDVLVLENVPTDAVSLMQDGADVIVQIANVNGSVSTIRLVEALATILEGSSGRGVEEIRFVNGAGSVVWDVQTLRSLLTTGAPGDGALVGGSGGDVLRGAASEADTGRDRIGGRGGDDVIYGGAGDDTLTGEDGYDLLFGGEGNDLLRGEIVFADAGDDTIVGESERDTGFIRGGTGNDRITGGTNDTFHYYAAGDGDDVIDDLGGRDRLVLENIEPSAVRLSRSGDAVIVSIRNADGTVSTIRLEGSAVLAMRDIEGAGVESISFSATAFRGEIVWGLAEIRNRLLIGTDGDSTIEGTNSAERISGAESESDPGNDSLSGLAGDDTLVGGGGNDTLVGGSDFDEAHGGDGNDFIRADVVFGGAGDDTIEGESARDVGFLRGGAGNDVIKGRDNATFYYHAVGDGDDEIADLGGVDTLVLEEIDPLWVRLTAVGNDILVTITPPNGPGSTVTLRASVATAREGKTDAGLETIVFTVGAVPTTVWTSADIRSRIFVGTDGDTTLVGSEFADVLSGADSDTDGGRDFLSGGGGSDTIFGGGGDDTLFGGDGLDEIRGGAGNDSLSGETVFGGDGNDTIVADVSGGTVRINGGTGNDRIDISNTSAIIDYALGDGNDTISVENGTVTTLNLQGVLSRQVTFVRGDATFNIEIRDLFTPSRVIARINLVGNHFGWDLDNPLLPVLRIVFADTEWGPADIYPRSLTGTSSNENFLGTGGDDYMFGAGGDDTLTGGRGNDVINGGIGSDLYIYNSGDGNDTIVETRSDPSGNDILRLNGIDPTKVTVGGWLDSRTDLFLQLPDGSRITIDGMRGRAPGSGIEQIQFWFNNALTVWTRAQVLARFFEGRTTENVDSVAGTGLDDLIYGLGGNDTIRAFEGNNSLFGGAGDDWVEGGSGRDSIDGGNGNDKLIGWEGNDTIRGDAGDDQIFGGEDIFYVSRSGARVFSTDDFDEGADSLSGGAGNDWIWAGRGHDTVEGGTGNDVIFGGAGNDRIIAGEESTETLNTEPDNDSVLAGDGDDEVSGGRGEDTLSGENGSDTLFGGAGNDSLFGGAGADSLDGGAGNDVLDGGVGNDTLTGGAGADVFRIRAGGSDMNVVNDFNLGEGDRLEISGYANLAALRNALTASFENGRRVFLLANTKIFVADPAPTLDQIASRITIVPQNFAGTSMEDTIVGSNGPDVVNGGERNDLITLRLGNDRVEIRTDRGIGISGHDTITDFASGDVLALGSGVYSALGIDTGVAGWQQQVISRFERVGSDLRLNFLGQSVTLQNVASLPTTALAVIAENLELRLGEGDDVRIGGSGNDSLFGGGGNDSLVGSSGADLLRGGDGNDTLSGGNDADTLSGGRGDDSLTGGGGNDVFQIGGADGVGEYVGHDTITDFAVGDRIQINSALFRDMARLSNAITQVTGGYRIDFDQRNSLTIITTATREQVSAALSIVNIEIVGATTYVDVLRGTSGDDTLVGTNADEMIFGHGGNDRLTGGAGNDIFFIGGRVEERRAIGHDTITDFSSSDRIRIHSALATNFAQLQIADLENGTGARIVFDDANSLTILNWNKAQLTSGFFEFEDRSTFWLPEFNGSLIHPAESIVGTLGHDDIRPLEGQDTVLAGAGNDTITGANTRSAFFGEAGNDSITGSSVSDLLDGGDDNDTIFGGAGDDTIVGGGGNDNLFGDSGWDRIEGGAGNDTLTGGAGRDTFVFVKNATGRDVITDFTLADDFIALNGFTQADWDAALAGASISGGTVILTFDAATSITLQNVTGIATRSDLTKISVSFF